MQRNAINASEATITVKMTKLPQLNSKVPHGTELHMILRIDSAKATTAKAAGIASNDVAGCL